MKIPPVKGTRDFYPPDMAVRNFIIDGWKKVSLRNGFEEYDGPIFEYLKMFQLKSGDEIVEQLFSLKDRGGRDLALRPEITPTLARMVNQQINSLPKPIKWFSVPRLFRAERPQRGRLREFFQWNIDIIGVDNEFRKALADAEVIFTTVDYLREIGLTSNDVKVKISSRKLLSAVLKQIGVPEEMIVPLYTLLDKKPKLPPKTFTAMLVKQVGDKMARKIVSFMELKSITGIEEVIGAEIEADTYAAYGELALCMDFLSRQMGVGEYCELDPGIVRGLAYYTGIVFEVHDVVGELRAICGGGRFDNLLHDFGGPQISATGMGMGDCVLEILLREKGLLGRQVNTLDYFIIPVGQAVFDNDSTPLNEAIKLTAKLRTLGFKAVFSYKSTSLSKQLKEASEQNAKTCIIIGDEFREKELAVRDMASGRQDLVVLSEFLEQIESKAK